MESVKKAKILAKTKKALSITGKVINWILLIVFSLLLFFNIYNIFCSRVLNKPLPMLFGVASAVVESGSMEPTISVDDMVIIVKQKEYHADDVITFYQDNMVVTHRIISVNGDGTVTTQGDANNTADKPISVDVIFGKVVAVVDDFAKLQNFVKSTDGMLLLIAVAIILILLPNASDLIAKFKKKHNKGENNVTNQSGQIGGNQGGGVDRNNGGTNVGNPSASSEGDGSEKEN